ncbi:MAG: hypothetical protein JWM77_2252 [Rhodospirillales bacterium]|nr:hypothetical protein [Rhodospirillales bacterium]
MRYLAIVLLLVAAKTAVAADFTSTAGMVLCRGKPQLAEAAQATARRDTVWLGAIKGCRRIEAGARIIEVALDRKLGAAKVRVLWPDQRTELGWTFAQYVGR